MRLWFLVRAFLSSRGTIEGSPKGPIFTIRNQSGMKLSEPQFPTFSHLRISLHAPYQRHSFLQPSVTESHNWSKYTEQLVPSLSWWNYNTIPIPSSKGPSWKTTWKDFKNKRARWAAERVSFIYNRGAVLLKSQQYGHLNKSCRLTSVDRPMG